MNRASEHLITAFAVEQSASADALDRGQLGMDRRWPHDSLGHQPWRRKGSDQIKVIMDDNAFPLSESQMSDDQFLPL
jgi:hypothetical protein